ncbi:hypothetical protein RvY_15887 [Ramazzottius varieornatus]|uniref:Nematode cuticle collagen N-terminal domain-containing protein n=1 Tax=Ramazzottius varieornatus TaxID=947166 RepID=A0A1D1VWH8_RAMVA|nr:hypothetical protein RvY_15887 [Ramazzottius varieornatus]
MCGAMLQMVSQRYGNFMTADQVSAKLVEYAQEFNRMMEHRCDVQKRSLMDHHSMHKIAAVALVAALVSMVCAFAVTVPVLRGRINALQVHQRDVMLAMQNVSTLPRPGQVARGSATVTGAIIRTGGLSVPH